MLDGRYRAIKFAARTPLPWTRTRQNGVGRGVTCSMAIILAFQIAELLAKELVESDYCSTSGRGWISDKYGALNPSKTYSPEYLQYLNRIRANSPAAVEDSEEPIHVSADFWKGGIPIEEFVHQSFPLDAKCTGAAGIAAYFLQNSTYWLNLGEIPAPQLHASPAQKIQEQKRRRNSFNDSLAQLTIFAQQNPALVSPRLSPSPISIPSPVEQLWTRALASLSSPVQLTRQLSGVKEVSEPIATSEQPEVPSHLTT